MTKDKMHRLYVGVGIGIAIVVVLVLLGWILWWLMLQVPPNVARAWALFTTVLVPITGYACWWIGHLEARGRLDGIDQAVNKVIGAAARTASVQVRAAREARHAEKVGAGQAPAHQQVPLPEVDEVEVIHRRSDRGGIVNL